MSEALKKDLRIVASSHSRSKTNKMDMRFLVRALIKYNASDLHLKVGRPPLYRINGKLVPAKMDVLDAEKITAIAQSVMSERQLEELEKNFQVDFSFRATDLGRFRCNVYYQRGSWAMAIRMIPLQVPELDQLGVPGVAKELCTRPRGLLLVTGATGQGKSTTLSAMVQHINESSYLHILTIEDPIEYAYRDVKATISQREVGQDAKSFSDALKAGLRQDPDIIVIGELRDREVIQTALTAAETGHLVLSTLHTNDARSTIERILDVFPAEAQNQIRIQLASVLIGVISQQLIVRADGQSRILAAEVMVKSPTIESLILKDELIKIPEAMAQSKQYYKMQTFNQDLIRLIRAGEITLEAAMKASRNPEELKLQVSGITHEDGFDIRSE